MRKFFKESCKNINNEILFSSRSRNRVYQCCPYYEECETNLGFDFTLEVHSAIERIIAYPKSWSIVDNKIRRSLVKRFPYGILYFENEEDIFILAIMHLHRDPNYWKDRKI